jgi:hypothetical protein
MPPRAADTAQAERLKAARIAAGHASARAAAEAHGWSVDTYAQHENGTRGLTSMAETYARAYRVTTAWLLTGSGPGPNQPRAREGEELLRIFFGLKHEDQESILRVARSLSATAG